MEDRIKKIMSEILDVEYSDINEESSLHSMDKWDSFKHTELILALEKEFGIRFDDEEIPTMVNLPIIMTTVISYID
jgi:acyl carrier protein